MSHLTPISELTSEQRAEMLAKSQASREKSKEEGMKLFHGYTDKGHWQELASKYGYRLPVWYHKAGSKFVNRFLKHFGLDKEWYQDHTGYVNGNKEAEENPLQPAYAQVGYLLEAYDEDKGELK